MPEAGRGFGHIDSASGNLIPQVECYSVAAAKQIVAASNGIGTATLSMVKRELHAGVLVPIALMVPGLETDYSIIALRGRTLTPAAEAFVNIVRAVDEEMDESLPTFRVSKADKQRHRMVSLSAKL
jgi:DNA-binding transcriptional LysR family regulator